MKLKRITIAILALGMITGLASCGNMEYNSEINSAEDSLSNSNEVVEITDEDNKIIQSALDYVTEPIEFIEKKVTENDSVTDTIYKFNLTNRNMQMSMMHTDYHDNGMWHILNPLELPFVAYHHTVIINLHEEKEKIAEKYGFRAEADGMEYFTYIELGDSKISDIIGDIITYTVEVDNLYSLSTTSKSRDEEIFVFTENGKETDRSYMSIWSNNDDDRLDYEKAEEIISSYINDEEIIRYKD